MLQDDYRFKKMAEQNRLTSIVPKAHFIELNFSNQLLDIFHHNINLHLEYRPVTLGPHCMYTSCMWYIPYTKKVSQDKIFANFTVGLTFRKMKSTNQA